MVCDTVLLSSTILTWHISWHINYHPLTYLIISISRGNLNSRKVVILFLFMLCITNVLQCDLLCFGHAHSQFSAIILHIYQIICLDTTQFSPNWQSWISPIEKKEGALSSWLLDGKSVNKEKELQLLVPLHSTCIGVLGNHINQRTIKISLQGYPFTDDDRYYLILIQVH